MKMKRCSTEIDLKCFKHETHCSGLFGINLLLTIHVARDTFLGGKIYSLLSDKDIIRAPGEQSN